MLVQLLTLFLILLHCLAGGTCDWISFERTTVNVYLEFTVLKANHDVFPSSWGVIDFTESWYNIVPNETRLHDLKHGATFANVKIVNSIHFDGVDIQGDSLIGVPSMVVNNSYCEGKVVVHEFGHVAGLAHRGDTGLPAPPFINNPGDPEDTAALMHRFYPGSHEEVNREEAGAFRMVETNLFWSP